MKDLERALRRPGPGAPDGVVEDLVRRALDQIPGAAAYAAVDSPFGPLTVVVTGRGLARLAYPGEDDVLEDVAARLTPKLLESPERADAVRRELDEYFAGTRAAFDLPIDWSLIRPGFTRKVLRATARVAFGRTLTYTDVARRAGSPRAYRAAGNALGSNPIPIVVPCHRILHSGGGLGGYTGGLERKEFLLRLEGSLEA